MKILKNVLFGLLLTMQGCVANVESSTKPANEVLRRVLPERAAEFRFEAINKDAGKDIFEIVSEKERIVIRASNPVAMCSGFHWYLKHVAKCHVSWNGDQLNLPVPLPAVQEKIRITNPYKHGFYFNYCTFNYSMSWWDWERWEREIDYMALCGIDMPLAIVGSEAIWLNFLKRFGYTHEQAKAFIAGPGYTAWWMMGNLEGRGGPVTDAWVDSRIKLQRKILARMRELGMKPVLPGFIGLVPSNLTEIVPTAKTLPQGTWVGEQNTRPHVLHPEQPLFETMARAWYEELEKLYGKADCFAGDLFHEGGKTHGLNIAAIASKVQGYMLEHNPQAIWTIQGWGGNPRSDLLSGLKKENTLVVELCCEFWRNWERSQGFDGFPWTFSTIIMYGGNVGFHGRLDSIAGNLNAALESKFPPVALGATWESIEVNPIVMDYIWDMRWRQTCPPPAEWAQDYAVRRYGADLPPIRAAWKKLVQTAYGSYPDHRRPTESIFCAIPSLDVKKVSPFSGTCTVFYDQRELRDALILLLSAADQCQDEQTYRFDVLDVARQFMANAAQIPYRQMVEAFKQQDRAAFEKNAELFLQMLDDQDRLLGCEPLYMLGKWLNDARQLGPTAEQTIQNEKNARLLITLWNEEKSALNNYAWKEWNGLLGRYYKPRWVMFIDELKRQLDGKPPKNLDYYSFEYTWATQTWREDAYPYTSQANPVAIARELVEKYGHLLDAAASPNVVARPKEDYIGTWEYKTQDAVWRRVLSPDGTLELYRDGQKWTNWNGFMWEYKDGKVSLRRADGSVFSTMTLLESGKADFGGDIPEAIRIETGENTEAAGS